MNQYLLSVHMGQSDAPAHQMTPEEMQGFMERVIALEAEMDASGTFVFGGRLTGPDDAAVVRTGDGNAVTTDGPYIETKEHIGGFYIINAADRDAAMAWAAKVTDAIGAPIEVRPFQATGRVKDQMGGG